MDLVELSKTLPVLETGEFDQDLLEGDPTFVGDEHAAFVVILNRVINILGGVPVAHVISPTVLTVLQSATVDAFSVLKNEDGTLPDGKHVGTLFDIPVLIDTYAGDDVPARTISFGKDGDLRVCEVFLKNIRFF